MMRIASKMFAGSLHFAFNKDPDMAVLSGGGTGTLWILKGDRQTLDEAADKLDKGEVVIKPSIFSKQDWEMFFLFWEVIRNTYGNLVENVADEKARKIWEGLSLFGFSVVKETSLDAHERKVLWDALYPSVTTGPLVSGGSGGVTYSAVNTYTTSAVQASIGSDGLTVNDANGKKAIELGETVGVKVKIAEDTFIIIDKTGIHILDEKTPSNSKMILPIPGGTTP